LCTRVDIGVKSGFVLNPFDLAADERTRPPSPKKISNLLSLIGLMLATDGQEELSAVEKALLDKLICSAYAEALSVNMVPTMSDLVRLTRQAGDEAVDSALRNRLHDLAHSLSLFTKDGSFGYFLDGATNFDAEKQLLIFDTSKISEPRLQKIAIALLIDLIERKADEYRYRAIRFTAILDDACDAMRSHEGACRLEELSRQARSWGLMLVYVVRKLGNFSRHKDQACAIARLCDTKLIFPVESRECNLLNELFSLTIVESENVKRIMSSQKDKFGSDCLLVIGDKFETIRFLQTVNVLDN